MSAEAPSYDEVLDISKIQPEPVTAQVKELKVDSLKGPGDKGSNIELNGRTIIGVIDYALAPSEKVPAEKVPPETEILTRGKNGELYWVSVNPEEERTSDTSGVATGGWGGSSHHGEKSLPRGYSPSRSSSAAAEAPRAGSFAEADRGRTGQPVTGPAAERHRLDLTARAGDSYVSPAGDADEVEDTSLNVEAVGRTDYLPSASKRGVTEAAKKSEVGKIAHTLVTCLQGMFGSGEPGFYYTPYTLQPDRIQGEGYGRGRAIEVYGVVSKGDENNPIRLTPEMEEALSMSCFGLDTKVGFEVLAVRDENPESPGNVISAVSGDGKALVIMRYNRKTGEAERLQFTRESGGQKWKIQMSTRSDRNQPWKTVGLKEGGWFSKWSIEKREQKETMIGFLMDAGAPTSDLSEDRNKRYRRRDDLSIADDNFADLVSFEEVS